MEEFELKPEKGPFIYLKLVLFLLFLLIIFVPLILILTIILENIIWVGVGIISFFTISIIVYFYLIVRYKKEKYIFKNNKIVARKGGFFSDHETEVMVNKITQVKARLPFVENKLFKTGSISINAAGSSKTEIYISNVARPKDLYKKIKEIMENNGFKLSRKNLIQKEKPNSLGIIIHILRKYGFIGTIPLMPFVIYEFMKIGRRNYYLYEEMVEYTEIFLTKNYSIIPMENLANCEITQEFWEKLFDIYDIKMSCQGSQNKILFNLMKKGKKFKSNVDRLIEETPSLADKKNIHMGVDEKGQENSETAKFGQEKVKTSKDKVVKKEIPKNEYTKELRMKFFRSLFPPLLLLIIVLIGIALFAIITIIITGEIKLILGIIIASPSAILFAIMFAAISVVYLIIRVYCTRFNINKNSVSEDFSFLTSRRMEFTIEKITSVIIKENFIDKWFGTITIAFTSIGSGQSVNFKNIEKDKEVFQNILLKTGFKSEQLEKQANSKFSLGNMLKSHLFSTIFILALMITSIIASIFYPLIFILPVAIIIIFPFIFIYKKIFYSYSKIFFYESFVFFQKGWLFKEYHYALYSNIKDMVSLKYPFTDKGNLTFNVAGETFVQDPKNTQNSTKPSLISSIFTIRYLPHVKKFHDYSDSFLNKYIFNSNKINQSQINLSKNIMNFNPSLGNYIFTLIIFSIIIFPLIVFLPITIPAKIIIIKRISYKMQSERIVRDSGVFYRKRKTVLFNRIDHLTKSEGLVNKIFSNGNLEVLTIGSGSPEMSIKNIREYMKVYSKLEDFY